MSSCLHISYTDLGHLQAQVLFWSGEHPEKEMASQSMLFCFNMQIPYHPPNIHNPQAQRISHCWPSGFIRVRVWGLSLWGTLFLFLFQTKRCVYFSRRKKKKNCWLCNLGKEATSQTESYKVKIEPYVDRMNFTFFSVSHFFPQSFIFCQQQQKKSTWKCL